MQETTSLKQPVTLHILGASLWEVSLYLLRYIKKKKKLLNLNSATFGPLSFLILEENNNKKYVYKKPLKKTLHPLILCKSSLDVLWWKEYLAICDYHLGAAEIVPSIKIRNMNKYTVL